MEQIPDFNLLTEELSDDERTQVSKRKKEKKRG